MDFKFLAFRCPRDWRKARAKKITSDVLNKILDCETMPSKVARILSLCQV